MAQIQSNPSEYSLDVVKINTDSPDLDLTEASKLAKTKARSIDHNAMMLSWHSGKTGKYWPTHDCGSVDRPPWLVFAESRGYNLKIDVNDGDYEFFYLRF